MPGDVEPVEDETFDRIWKFIQEIGIQERHFNDLQSRYRSMASAWLLATFAAIGFVISRPISLDIDVWLLAAGIAVAGSLGIALLWVVDLLVYHRLLDSCFIESLILEEQYPWLPSIRSNMMKTQRGEGVLFRVVVFYLGPIILLVIIAGGALSIWLGKQFWWAAILSFDVSLLVALLIGYIIRSKRVFAKSQTCIRLSL